MAASGVPLRTKAAFHDTNPKPGAPASARVGISGTASERVGPLTPSALSMPERTSGATPAMAAATASTWPAAASVMACEVLV
ncbi:Uncharacterised protein [Bordetella pertussis]|nr:Uncharacterised protein [Bordetella pertussis]